MDFLRVRLGATSPLVEELLHNILRVPGLVIVELLIRMINNDDRQNIHERIQHEFRSWIEHFEFPLIIKARNFDVIVENVLNCSVLLLGFTFLVLPTKKLISVYLHIVGVLLLGAAYYLSFRYVQTEQTVGGEVILDDFVKLERHGFHFLSQVLLAVVVSCLLSVRDDWARVSLTVYAVPIVARLCGFPAEKLHVTHNFASCFIMLMTCFYVLNAVPGVLTFLRRAESRVVDLVRARGYWGCTRAVWRWAKLPSLFALFFCVLCVSEFYALGKLAAPNSPPRYGQILYGLANCCATPLSLLSFGAATYYFSYLTLIATSIFIKGTFDWVSVINTIDNEIELMHGGVAEVGTFLLLSIQTDLVNRSVEQKTFLICILLFIVLSSLFQSMFDVVEPVLLRIGASQSTDYQKHLRVLLLCTVLFVGPIAMSATIAILLPIDVWLLIIISSCVLISVQTLGSTFIYALFVYDALRSGNWERLDDLVFWCRSAIRVVEFTVAFAVIAFGVRESIFGEWSWANSSILILHCYFNVWQRLQAGWKSFLLRREAASKLEMVPVACRQQLENLQDVCSICYQEMHEARVTPCNHFFHGGCLKKWLYVQQTCPMCHWDLSFKKRSRSENRVDNEEGYSSEEDFSTESDYDTVGESSEHNE